MAASFLSLLCTLTNVGVLATHAGLDLGGAWRAIAGAAGWSSDAAPPPPQPTTTPGWNVACNRPMPHDPPPYGYPAWAPPPPPLPAVPKQQVRQLILDTFGNCAHDALVIAHCESNFDNTAWNDTPVLSSHAAGVFQILWKATWDRTWDETNNAFDAAANVRSAYAIFSYDGDSWLEWATAKCLPGGCSWCPGTQPS